MVKTVPHDIKDLKFAPEGKKKIEWAGQNMPVLQLITQEFKKTKPLKGISIGACLHVTSETANLILAYLAGGASVALCASNPLSTQDMVQHLWFPIMAYRCLRFTAKTEKPITNI